MIVPVDDKVIRNRENQALVDREEEVAKAELLKSLSEESMSVICLAVVYAKNFDEYGCDVTERWMTAEQQSQIIKAYYKKGYNEGYVEGIVKGKELEREEARQIAEEKRKGYYS